MSVVAKTKSKIPKLNYQKQGTFITDDRQMKRVMNLGVKKFSKTLGKSMAIRLKDNTNELIYESYNPEKYERTMDMLNSVYGPGFNTPNTIELDEYGGTTLYTVEVGFDTNKMRLIPPHGRVWGKHTGFHGEDARDAVISGFEERGFIVVGGKGGKRLVYRRLPVHMMEITMEETINSLDKLNKNVTDFDYLEKSISISLMS